MNAERLLTHYEKIADAPDAIPRLRRFILDFAVRGKLVEQDQNDESASELLKRIAAKKARLVKAGEIRKRDDLPEITENEFPFTIPPIWCWYRLGGLGFTQTGTTPPKAKGENYGNYIPFIKPGDIYATHMEYSGEGLSKIGVNNSGRIAPAGSILMVCIGTIGKCQKIDRECSFNQQINSLSPYVETSSEYLLAACQSDFFQESMWRASARTTIAILNKGNWERLPLPLPPLAEQYRIVAKVDELMALCDRLEAAQAERETTRDRLATASLARLNAPDPDPAVFQGHAAFALDNLIPLTTRPDQIKALRQTILNLAVRGKLVEQDPNDDPASELLKKIGVEKARLVKAGDIKKPNALPPVDEPPFGIPITWLWARIRQTSSDRGQTVPEADFTYVDVTSIDKEKGIIATPTVVLVNEAPSRARKIVLKGDVVYSCVRPYLLNVAVVEDAFNPPPIASTAFAILDGHGFVLPRFQWIVLRSPFMVACVKEAMRGQAYPAINDTDFARLPFPLPPLAEQRRIVAKVDELMALCNRLEESLATGDDTRRCLLDALLYEALEPVEGHHRCVV